MAALQRLPPQPDRAAWLQSTLLIHVAWVWRVRNVKLGADYECDSCPHPFFGSPATPLSSLYRVHILICSARPCGVGGWQARRFVRFCYYVPKLLLHFPFCVLFRHTCAPRQFVPTDSVYL